MAYLKEAGRLSESSIDRVATAIDRFADYNKQRRTIAGRGGVPA